MRPDKNTMKSWRFTNSIQRQLPNLTVFRAVLFFGLLAGLALSFTLYPSLVTTAQEQKPNPASDILITAQAEGVGLPADASVVPTGDAPEGGSCNWVADTVYPITVQDHAMAATTNALFGFAGQSNSAFTASSFKFDGTAWTPIAPLPTAVVGAGAASDGTNVYIVAGVATGGVFQNTVNRYNVATNDYTALAPAPTATWNHVTLYNNGKIYKIGGSTAAASTTIVEIYDIATNAWTTGAPLPQPTSFGHGFVRGNFLYIAGGLNSTGSVASLKTYRYDIAANTWDDAAIADLPQTRWAGVSSKIGYGSTGAFLIAGGFVNGTAVGTESATAVEWDPVANSWSSIPSNMPGARFRGNGGVLGGSFYHVGGGPPNFTGTNTNYKLTCVSGVAIVNGGTVNITAESCGTPNGAPDPGETLSVTLPITNSGDTATTNLNVTLQATGGVVAASTQNYGAVAPGGAGVTRTFTFTVASGTVCGGDITLTFTPVDGATTYPNIVRTYTTGALTVSLTQNFDGVTAPALPAGWTSVQTAGTLLNWVTSTTTPSSAPNAAFGNEVTTVNAAALVSPAVAITSASSRITFKNKYNLEESTTAGAGFDGTVLEYTTNGGTTWTDIITGGGTFVSGGYTDTISTAFMSPISGRMAWSGNSTNYIDTVVNLPASLNGQTVQFRWLRGDDSSAVAAGVAGHWIDDVQVLGARTCQSCGPVTVCNIQRRNDFNGDGKTDYATFRPSDGSWYILPNGSTAATATAFGINTDKLQPGDYDGDGKTDIAVYRGGTWYWLRSSDSVVVGIQFGAASDVPVIGDYVGDNKADLTVYRSGTWYTRDGGTGAVTAVQWGGDSTDVPAPGDFDNDCKYDYAVRRTTNDPVANATTWYIRRSSGGATSYRWGTNAMQMALADYNGDGSTDIGVAELRGGVYLWYVLSAANPSAVLVNGIEFGTTGDVIVPGDYGGDSAADLAIWRPSPVASFSYRTVGSATPTVTTFGANGDIPTARAYQYPLP